MSEQAVVFGRTNSLIGVVTDPPGLRRRGCLPAILFLDAGFIHHVGPNRLYVTTARRLAAAGFLGLRFDFSGIGDSPSRPDHLPFQKSAVGEVREAMDWLSQARSCDRFILIGICSGASFALQTACADPRVAGVILINLQGGLDQESQSHVTRWSTDRYFWRISLFSARSWRNALTERADYRGIARTIGTKLGGLFAPRPRLLPEAEADLARIRTLQERGIRVLVIYSEGDPGWEYLGKTLDHERGHSGASRALSIETIPRADHTFTFLDSQQRLCRIIDDWTTHWTDNDVDE
jgi:pimeloyl-ACP methyl ester carboxylesterase